MISETEWKFFEATEQRVKHLRRHQIENRLARFGGSGTMMDPAELATKQAAIVQEMEYPQRVESALASNPKPDQSRHLDLHRRWVLGTLFETHPEIFPLAQSLEERMAAFRPSVAGRTTTWAEVRRILREEQDRDLREAAWMSREPLAQALQEDMTTLLRLRETLARAVLQTGFPHVAYHAMQLERTDVISWGDEFERTTRDAFGRARLEIGEVLDIRDVAPWDMEFGIARMIGAAASAFPAGEAPEAAKRTAREWGIAESLPRVVAHEGMIESWPAPVEIPAETTLLVDPAAGAPAWERVFAGYGEACYHGAITVRRHFLEQEGPLMPEAIGRLFAGVLGDAEWIRQRMEAPAPLLRALNHALSIDRLMRLRENHAHTTFENIVYANSDQEPNRLFGDVMEQEWGIAARSGVLWSGYAYPLLSPLRLGVSIPAAGAAAQLRRHLVSMAPKAGPQWGAWVRKNFAEPAARMTWEEKLENAVGAPLAFDALYGEMRIEKFRGPQLEEDRGREDEAVAEYFKDIDLSDIDLD